MAVELQIGTGEVAVAVLVEEGERLGQARHLLAHLDPAELAAEVTGRTRKMNPVQVVSSIGSAVGSSSAGRGASVAEVMITSFAWSAAASAGRGATPKNENALFPAGCG